ncbi:hypothetical protein D9M71_771120 [compost metagenome]
MTNDEIIPKNSILIASASSSGIGIANSNLSVAATEVTLSNAKYIDKTLKSSGV